MPSSSHPTPRKESCVWVCTFQSAFAHVCVMVCIKVGESISVCLMRKCVWMCGGVFWYVGEWACDGINECINECINELAHTCVYVCLCVPLSCMSENTRVSLYECGLEWVFEWAWMWVRVSVRSCVFDGVSAAALVGGMEGGDRTLMLRLLDLALNWQKREHGAKTIDLGGDAFPSPSHTQLPVNK